MYKQHNFHMFYDNCQSIHVKVMLLILLQGCAFLEIIVFTLLLRKYVLP